ncbi:hypothetical protein TNCV_1819251 [Trichonephila clavipes]|nr:hypothetical protein TNCV_1819251 [Trichonephila clavipes]
MGHRKTSSVSIIGWKKGDSDYFQSIRMSLTSLLPSPPHWQKIGSDNYRHFRRKILRQTLPGAIDYSN